MTDTLWWHVKSMLDNEVGLKAPSAERLAAHTRPTQIPYETGDVISGAGVKGDFIRVKSVRGALEQVMEMHHYQWC